MEEPTEKNILLDDSMNHTTRKRTFSELEQDLTEPAAKVANNSENEELECAICKEVITTQVVGQPENCKHQFCLSCLIEWSKREAKCPLDRQTFTKIILPNAGKSHVEDFVVIYDAEVTEDDNDDPVEENAFAEDNDEVTEDDNENMIGENAFAEDNDELTEDDNENMIGENAFAEDNDEVTEDDNENMIGENEFAEDDDEDFVNILDPEVTEDDNDNTVVENDESDNSEDEVGTVCQFCDDDDTIEDLYNCNYCHIGFHLQCLTPPVSEVPLMDDGWSCCLVCSKRVCCVCGGSVRVPRLGGYMLFCIRCRKDFHSRCHEHMPSRLCPSCYLPQPAAPIQEEE